MKPSKIGVIGMGYIGIPVAALLANAGYKVTGIQRRTARSGWKIDFLNEGKCPIGVNEPELPGLLKNAIDSGRFRVTEEFDALKQLDIILIDVQTPTDEDHLPRYESLIEVLHQVGKILKPGKVVIIESTVAPGTTEHLAKPILETESGLKSRLPDGFGLCFAYERVMAGRLIHNIREYPKIIGADDILSLSIATEMYKSIVKGEIEGTNIMTAEVSKTVENAYRDVQIAFANEVALLCESLGVDIYELRKFVNGLPNDPSTPHANPIRTMHCPGAGVGGHCLPKDTWLLLNGYEQNASNKTKYPYSLLKDARYLNSWMPLHMVDLLELALNQAGKQLMGADICVLGYSFLENSDDPRNTPTIALLKELTVRGASYKIHDPYIKEDDGNLIMQGLEDALIGSDALVLMTKHNCYKNIDPPMLNDLMRTKVVIDGRNLFNPKEFIERGFIFRGIGKGNLNEERFNISISEKGMN
jgi:UDP-N-acetyl-D-mannosaminuronic acid dehydrogenase